MARLIDLGHRIYDGMSAYPGLPAARVEQIATHEQSRHRYEAQAEFALTRIELSGNTGTYIDSPWHRFSDAYDVAGIPLERVVDLPGIVIDADAPSEDSGVHATLDMTSVKGSAVLVRTGWSDRWGRPEYWSSGPHLSSDLVDELVRARPSVVGVDFSNVDDTNDPARPAHTRLLEADILIVEHLTNLGAIGSEPFRFTCVPLQIEGSASLPVRPFAAIEETGTPVSPA